MKEQNAMMIKNLMSTNFKRPLWQRIKDTISWFFIICLCIIGIILVFTIIYTLIENPLSLAIICGTILLIWMWSRR